MASPADHDPALDHDQQTALQALRAVFGAEQVTVTDVQPTRRPDPALHADPAWQARLYEEASCTSICS